MAVNETIERIVFEGVDKITSASKSAEASTRALKDTISSVKTILGALGVTVGAGAFIKLQLDALHATAALDDMAEATGASVEKLSAIQRVAKVGGQDFEGLTSQIGRMIKNLKDNTEEGNKAGAALGQLGLRARDANGHWRDTADILLDVARNMGRFRTDADRVAFVQDVLGKGAERYIPLLKDMAEGTDLVATTTAKQAEEAEKAEKNLNRLKLVMEDSRKELVNAFTPALVDFTNKLLAAKEATGGLASGLAAMFQAGQTEDVDKRLAEIDQRIQSLDKQARDLINAPAAFGVSNAFLLKNLEIQTGKLLLERQFLRKIQEKGLVPDASPGGAMDMGVGLSGVFPKGGLAYQSPNLSAEKKGREVLAAIMRKVREDEDKRELDQIALQNKARADATLAGEQSVVLLVEESLARRDEIDLARFERVKLLKAQQYGTEEEMEREAFEAKKAQMMVFTDEELEIYGGRHLLLENMEMEHQNRVIQIRLEALNKQRGMMAAGYRGQAQAVFGELASMTAGVAQHSKVLFEINKVATLATIALKTPEAIASAYAFGARFGGPPLGAAMAAVAGLAMAAQFTAALNTKFGGGGVGIAPSVAGTTAATPVSPVAEPGPRQSITIKVVGHDQQQLSLGEVRKFLEEFADASEGGARIFVG